MAGRPKKISDEAVIEAAIAMINEIGPERLTLAELGSAAGLGASTLIQRFGSKRGLLLAVAEAGVNRTADAFAGRNIAAGFKALCEGITRPQQIANNLLFLHQDLSDPEFGVLARRQQDAARAAIARQLVARGVEASEAESEAGHLLALYSGTLIGWALAPECALQDAVEKAIGRYLDLLAC